MDDNSPRSKTHLELLNPPPGNSEKLFLLIPVHLVLFFIFFSSKAAFYFKAKLQELDVVISNSPALLLLWLISLAHFYLPQLVSASKEANVLSFFNFLTCIHRHTDSHSSTKTTKAAWILVTEIAINLKWQKLAFCSDAVRVARQSPNTLWGSASLPSLH